MNRRASSRAFWLAGWDGGKRGAAQRGIGAALLRREQRERVEYNEPRTSPEDIRVGG